MPSLFRRFISNFPNYYSLLPSSAARLARTAFFFVVYFLLALDTFTNLSAVSMHLELICLFSTFQHALD